MQNNYTYALVTGASRGLGKELAYELARLRHNLLLVSLKNEGLPVLCDAIRVKYSVDVQCFEVDLLEENAVFEIAEWASNGYKVNILINNAGVGETKAFDEVTPEYIENTIRINVRVISMLTRLVLPLLRTYPNAYILNVASMASFSPIPYKVIYQATKAYVWFFSRCLYEELRNSSVSVSVLHPGPMKTNSDVRQRIEKQSIFVRITLISAQKTARIAIAQMFKKKLQIIPGFMNKTYRLLIIIVPTRIRLNLVSFFAKHEAINNHSSSTR